MLDSEKNIKFELKKMTTPTLKPLTQYYKAPTSSLARKIGDAILSVGTLLTGSQILSGNKVIALVGLGLTVIGKLLTNFFPDNSQNPVNLPETKKP